MGDETGPQGFDNGQYEDEVRARWGHTEAYRESKARTAKFSKEDWARVKKDGQVLEERFATLLRAGKPADGPEAMEVAEAHRQYMENFYTCPHAMHVGLAQMYTADPRFAEHYNKQEPGLADFVSSAIQANAKRAAQEG